VNESDKDAAPALARKEMAGKGRAWAVHLSLFPLAQRVLNPPFINPHLPKMYRICRELLPYLSEGEVPALVRLEINEFTQRPKLREFPKPQGRTSSVSFPDIETAIKDGDPERVAALLNAFLKQKREAEMARNLLLLGSGYLDQSLGHSVSCTAFILLEMIERSDQDPWPALSRLAQYFCEGRFHTTPALRGKALPSEQALNRHLLRATSGDGIVNLHHTITRYAIERVRHLLSEEEYAHMISCWVGFMGAKRLKTPSPISPSEALTEYEGFRQHLSNRAEKPALSCLGGMTSSKEGRQRLGRYLIKGICDLYQGNYDPHFLTGLGSALWVVNSYWDRPAIAISALRQYVNYFSSRR